MLFTAPLFCLILKAVSELSRAHHQSLERLMAQQEAERQRLKETFEKKQQILIDQILKQFPSLNLNAVNKVVKPF